MFVPDSRQNRTGAPIILTPPQESTKSQFFETTNEDWHFFLNQQFTASWYPAKAFVPAMQDAGWGRIIHVNGPDGYAGPSTSTPASECMANSQLTPPPFYDS